MCCVRPKILVARKLGREQKRKTRGDGGGGGGGGGERGNAPSLPLPFLL